MTSILKVDEIQNTDGKTGIVITPDGSLESVKFPETTGGDPNRVVTSTTMSSYEEGIFTPVLESTGSNPSYKGSEGGRYTKVGDIVHFSAFIDMNPFTTNGSGEIYFSGLPFTIDAANGGGGQAISASVWGGTIGSGKNLVGQPINNSNRLRFWIWGDNSPQTVWTYATASFSSGDAIYVRGHYTTNE